MRAAGTLALALSLAACGGPAGGISRGDVAPSDYDGCGMEAFRLGADCWSAAGTRWRVVADAPSGPHRFEVETLAAGRLRATDHDGASPARDEWFQDGPVLRWFLADRFVEYRTTITNGTVLVGEAVNLRGQRWTWRADRSFGEVTCHEDETRVDGACMTVAGTHWELTVDGASRTLDFLADGVLGVADQDDGRWSQEGERLTLSFGDRELTTEVDNADRLEASDGSFSATRIVSIPPVMR